MYARRVLSPHFKSLPLVLTRDGHYLMVNRFSRGGAYLSLRPRARL